MYFLKGKLGYYERMMCQKPGFDRKESNRDEEKKISWQKEKSINPDNEKDGESENESTF